MLGPQFPLPPLLLRVLPIPLPLRRAEQGPATVLMRRGRRRPGTPPRLPGSPSIVGLITPRRSSQFPFSPSPNSRLRQLAPPPSSRIRFKESYSQDAEGESDEDLSSERDSVGAHGRRGTPRNGSVRPKERRCLMKMKPQHGGKDSGSNFEMPPCGRRYCDCGHGPPCGRRCAVLHRPGEVIRDCYGDENGRFGGWDFDDQESRSSPAPSARDSECGEHHFGETVFFGLGRPGRRGSLQTPPEEGAASHLGPSFARGGTAGRGASPNIQVPPLGRPLVDAPRRSAAPHTIGRGSSPRTRKHRGSHALEPGKGEAEAPGPGGDGELVPVPVVYNWQGANPRWEPFPLAHLKDLGEAAKEFGRESSSFRTMLQATFTATTLVPADLKTIMASLLDKPELWVWERAWKRRVRNLLSSYENDQRRAFLTMDHLWGEGDFEKAQDQADTIPAEVLKDIKEAAHKALLSLPTPGVPSSNFVSVKQVPGKNFFDFFKRLRAAVGWQVENEATQKDIIR